MPQENTIKIMGLKIKLISLIIVKKILYIFMFVTIMQTIHIVIWSHQLVI